MVKPGVIAAGKYTRQVFTVIEPTWPSSSSSIYNPLTAVSNNDDQSIANNTTHTIFQSKEVNITTHDDGGFVQYSFQAQITRVGLLNISHPIAAAAQELLVLNYSSFLTSGLPPSLRLAHTITVTSSKKGIPLQVAIPFDTVVFGQTVPVTVSVDSFLDTSVFAGREVVIMDARFGIHEIRQMRSLNNIVDKKVVVETFEIQVPGTSGGSWPQSRNGWRRTVDVQIPQSYFETVMDSAATPQQTSINSGMPRLLTSLKSKYYDVEHQLVVVLKVRTSGEKDKHAETLDLRLDLKIVHPLPDDMASAAEYQSIAAFLFERLSVVH
ncbi:hypothetical protein BGZ98_008973 [Dissophora globulifera]|nr:hypothetical protein BGZ98_008973 [Dissophora globulifera]